MLSVPSEYTLFLVFVLICAFSTDKESQLKKVSSLNFVQSL